MASVTWLQFLPVKLLQLIPDTWSQFLPVTWLNVEARVPLEPLQISHDVLLQRLLVQLRLPVVKVAQPFAIQQLSKCLLAALVILEVQNHGFQILLGHSAGRSEPS